MWYPSGVPNLGVDNRSPEQAYCSKPNIIYPGTQAQADNVETLARTQDVNQGTINGDKGGRSTSESGSGGSSGFTAGATGVTSVTKGPIKGDS